jgi:hypothetical protein
MIPLVHTCPQYKKMMRGSRSLPSFDSARYHTILSLYGCLMSNLWGSYVLNEVIRMLRKAGVVILVTNNQEKQSEAGRIKQKRNCRCND